jgi:hypothetical protein
MQFLHIKNGILIQKWYWPTVGKYVIVFKKNSCIFEVEGWEFKKNLDHLNNLFIQWKVRTIFEDFQHFTVRPGQIRLNTLEKKWALEPIIGM